MQQVTVGTKYQIVIPKAVRKILKGLKPGDKVGVYANSEQMLTIKTKVLSWSEQTRGIAKKAWKSINTTKYLEDLRNEWNRKV